MGTRAVSALSKSSYFLTINDALQIVETFLMRQPFRQGDVLLLPLENLKEGNAEELDHLVLAEGELTGHKHQITQGDAILLVTDEDEMMLKICSESALLSHEEHKQLIIPQGVWLVRRQREYTPDGWKFIAD